MTNELPVPAEPVRDAADSGDEDPSGSELQLITHDDGVVVMGADALVESYVRRIRDEAGAGADSHDLDPSEIAGVLATMACAGATAAQRGTFVKLSPRSVELLSIVDDETVQPIADRVAERVARKQDSSSGERPDEEIDSEVRP